jgi:hypothetical protein
MSPAEDALKTLLDKRALDELVYSTVAALDAGRWDDYRAAFAEDAKFVLPGHVDEPGAGDDSLSVAGFVERVRVILAGFDAVQHHVTNMIHELSADAALTRCYVIAEQFLGSEVGQNSIALGGAYEITSRREDGRWKLTRWSFTQAWTRGNPELFARAAERR